MGRKGGKYKRKEKDDPPAVKSARHLVINEDMMDDEIDAFHKSRDIIPLDVYEDMEEIDEDDELPVLDLKYGEDEDDEDGYMDDGDDDRGLTGKILRTQKYMQAKFGGVGDEIIEDADEEEQENVVWGRKKDLYGGDVDYEPQSSDDEDAAEEEAEVLKLQSQKAKAFTMDDFGLEDTSQDEDDQEPTFEEIMDHAKILSKTSLKRGVKDKEEVAFSIIKKDLSALTKEEQMDVVRGSDPELIKLLSELNDSLQQLETRVNPLVEKVRGQDSLGKGKMHYIEVKQILLLSYCQAISFYLLLKSEGQSVHDHPVVSRLMEIKSLLDKINEIDKNLPLDGADILLNDGNAITIQNSVEENTKVDPDFPANEAAAEPEDAQKPVFTSSCQDSEYKEAHHEEIGLQSKEMLKIRAALEEKLKQKGIFSSIAPKNHRVGDPFQPMNGKLETVDDFIDEAEEGKNAFNSHSNGGLQHAIPRTNKRKVISGDDDVPQRDDIGERRRKHELRVLSGAGIEPVDDEPETGITSGDEDGISGGSDSDPDLKYYHEMEKQHAAKRASKSIDHSRTSEVPFVPDTVEGKRQITRQIEKNRGLTRNRKKLTKNPRKKYKLKHKKAEIRRKGQVPDLRKPTGSYGGEATGINTTISRSIRFKG